MLAIISDHAHQIGAAWLSFRHHSICMRKGPRATFPPYSCSCSAQLSSPQSLHLRKRKSLPLRLSRMESGRVLPPHLVQEFWGGASR